MLKCNFSKVASQLYLNHTWEWVFSCKFAAYFQNRFIEERLWRTAFGRLGRHRSRDRNLRWMNFIENKCNIHLFEFQSVLLC